MMGAMYINNKSEHRKCHNLIFKDEFKKATEFIPEAKQDYWRGSLERVEPNGNLFSTRDNEYDRHIKYAIELTSEDPWSCSVLVSSSEKQK
jgi:hypothetical protein